MKSLFPLAILAALTGCNAQPAPVVSITPVDAGLAAQVDALTARLASAEKRIAELETLPRAIDYHTSVSVEGFVKRQIDYALREGRPSDYLEVGDFLPLYEKYKAEAQSTSPNSGTPGTSSSSPTAPRRT